MNAATANLPALPSSLTPEGNLSRYLQEIRKFPLLEPQEEFMLAKRWREHGDSKAAHKLVTSLCAAWLSPCSRQRLASMNSSCGSSSGNFRIS